MNIKMITKSDCPFCHMAKNWLKEHAFDYEEDLIDNEEDRLAFYQTINGATEPLGVPNTRRVNSVPQIFIDDKRIGGYDELMKISDDLLKKRSGARRGVAKLIFPVVCTVCSINRTYSSIGPGRHVCTKSI